jgi:hypothetical protein
VPNYELLISDLFCYAHEDSGNPYAYQGFAPGVSDGFFTGYMSDRTNGAVRASAAPPIPYNQDDIGSLLAGNDTVIINTYENSKFEAVESDTELQSVPVEIGRAHGAVVTGVDSTGVIVSSWGNEYYVFPDPGIPQTTPEVVIGDVVVVPGTITYRTPPTVTIIHWDE